MAYVMNPNTFKVGYSITWSDNWYSNNKLYPLMLHVILSVRSLICYFFFKKRIEKIDIYLSHLNIGLNSGSLFISLFLYDTKVDYKGMSNSLKLYQYIHIPQKYKTWYKFWSKKPLPEHKRHEHNVYGWHFKDVFIRYSWWIRKFNYRPFDDAHLEAIYRSQRFFLFFNYLGLAPDVLLLEYYKRSFFNARKWRTYRSINRRRIQGKKKWVYINVRETYILGIFYSLILNHKLSFDFLSGKNGDLNLMRLLRYLFFYGRMPHWGRQHYNITLPNKSIYIKNYATNFHWKNYKKNFHKMNVYSSYLKHLKRKKLVYVRKKKKQVKNAFAEVFLNIFFGKLWKSTDNSLDFTLRKVKKIEIPSFKSKILKKKYKILLKKVQIAFKKPNLFSYLFFSDLVENYYILSKKATTILKTGHFYKRYRLHESNMDVIRGYWDQKGKLAEEDIHWVGRMDDVIQRYFEDYHKFLPYFTLEAALTKKKKKWAKFWNAYIGIYPIIYNAILKNSVKKKNIYSFLTIKKKLDTLYKKAFLVNEVKTVKIDKKIKINGFLLNKGERSYLNKLKKLTNVPVLKPKKKRRLTVNERLAKKKAEDAALKEKAELFNKLTNIHKVYTKAQLRRKKVTGFFSDLFNQLSKSGRLGLRTNSKKKLRPWKLQKLEKRVNYGFNMLNHFDKKYLFLQPKTRQKINSEFFTMSSIRFSYARMFFMLWILKLNTQLRKMSPYRLIEQNYFKKLNIYETIYLFFFLLIKRPFLKKICFFISSLITKWCGFNTKFHYYIITNNEITSSYIAKHIAYAFRLRFSWRDVVRPIKRDLNYLLSGLRVLEYGYDNKYINSFKKLTEETPKDIFEHDTVFMSIYKKRYLNAIVKNLKKEVFIKYFNILWRYSYFSVKKRVSKRFKYYWVAKMKRDFFEDYMFGRKTKNFVWTVSIFFLYLLKLKNYFFLYLSIQGFELVSNFGIFFLKKNINNLFLSKIRSMNFSLCSIFNNIDEEQNNYLKDIYYNMELLTREKTKKSFKLDLKKTLINWQVARWEFNLERDYCRVTNSYWSNIKFIGLFYVLRMMHTFYIYFFRSKRKVVNLGDVEAGITNIDIMKICFAYYANKFILFKKFLHIYITLRNLLKWGMRTVKSWKDYYAWEKIVSKPLNIIVSSDRYVFYYLIIWSMNMYILQKDFIWSFKDFPSWSGSRHKELWPEKSKIWLNKMLFRAYILTVDICRYYKISKKLVSKFFTYFHKIVLNNRLKLLKFNFLLLVINNIEKVYENQLNCFFWTLDFWNKFENSILNTRNNYLNLNGFILDRDFRFLFSNINRNVNKINLNIFSLLDVKKFRLNLTQSLTAKNLRWHNYSMVLKKKTFIDYFYKNRVILGYKLRLAGRFRRRRKRTIVWIKRGMLPISSHEKIVDYGQSVTANEFSTYSVRVWINRNTNYKQKYFLKF